MTEPPTSATALERVSLAQRLFNQQAVSPITPSVPGGRSRTRGRGNRLSRPVRRAGIFRSTNFRFLRQDTCRLCGVRSGRIALPSSAGFPASTACKACGAMPLATEKRGSQAMPGNAEDQPMDQHRQRQRNKQAEAAGNTGNFPFPQAAS